MNIPPGSIFIPKIRIENEGHEILIQPVESLYVENKYLVFLYELTYTYQNEILTAIIPYYMSDGATNGVRVNALLPFMCFNEYVEGKPQSEYSNSCPFSKNTYGLLYKYVSCNNINFNNLNNLITSSCNFIEPEKKELIFKEHYYQKIAYSIGGGPYSFLPRIQNILDFIICISSHKISTIDNLSDQRLYLPIFNLKNEIEKYYENAKQSNEQAKKFYDRFRKLSNPPVRTEWEDTIMKMNKDEKIFNQQIIDSVPTCYRYNLLKILKKLHEITRINILSNLEFIEVNGNINLINYVEFNKMIRICESSKIPDYTNENYEIYKLISAKMFNIFSIKKQSISEISYNNISLLSFCIENNLDQNISAFNATCDYEAFIEGEKQNIENIEPSPSKRKRVKGGYYEKYLKYKKMYLMLKSKILKNT